MRLAIVGSRDFRSLELVADFISKLKATTKVVSGGARGVDREAVRLAKLRGLQTEEFLANWGSYGKSAGFRRNEEMISTAQGVVAFWDGSSRGTRNAIDLAIE